MSVAGEFTAFTMWGFEFAWRRSQWYPLQWRRPGDRWVCAHSDSPLVAAVRAEMARRQDHTRCPRCGLWGPTVDVATLSEREPRPIPACACDQEPPDDEPSEQRLEILPPVHPVRSARPRGPRAWLFSLVVPRRALAWGRLTLVWPWEPAPPRPHDFGPAFERLASTMDAPGKRTADAFVPAQFDGWWQP